MFRACDRAAAFQPGSERDTARANSRDARGGVLVAERRNASCAGERSVVPHPRARSRLKCEPIEALTSRPARGNAPGQVSSAAARRRGDFPRRRRARKALPREHSRARARERVGRERPSANGPGLRPPCSPMRWSGRCADPARFFVPQIFSSRGSSRTLFRPRSPRRCAPPTRPALPLRDAASRSDCASPLEATSRGPTRFLHAFSR
jgi:hypothetical protein